MEQEKNPENWIKSFKKVFGNKKYIVIAIVASFIFYILDILIFNWKNLFEISKFGIVPLISFIGIQIIKFKDTLLLHSFITLVIISILVGILSALILYKIRLNAPIDKKTGLISTIGLFFGALAPGCAACGIGLVSALGLTGIIINFLPFNGLEISFLSIGILSFAIFKTAKGLSKPSVCKVNVQKDERRYKNMSEENSEKGNGFHKNESKTITIKKDTLWKVGVIVLAILLVISLFTGGFGITGKAVDNENPSEQQPIGEPLLEGAHTMGNPDAEVVMVEYSSYTCGFCGRHHTQTWPAIKEEFVDTNKVLFVYKHYPRVTQDLIAVNAAECAGEQDEFFAMNELIYANQQDISESSLKEWAQSLEIDMTEFNECFNESPYNIKANADREEAISMGVTGTPGFLINGVLISGACPLDTFEKAIKAEMNGEDWIVTQCQFRQL